jgi:hypothetical protein
MKDKTRRRISAAGISCLAGLIGACQEGGNDDDRLAVRGYFLGQFTKHIGTQTFVQPAVAIGSDSPGHFHVATADGIEQFDVEVLESSEGTSGHTFGAVSRVFATDSGAQGLNPIVGEVVTNGTYRPGETLSVRFEFENGFDTADLTYRDDIYENAASLATIAGGWHQDGDDGYQLTISLNASGQAAGSDSRACTYSATFTALTDQGASVNWFRVDENAGCVEETLSGVAVLVRAGVNGNPSDRLVVLTAGETVAAARGFNRIGS